MNSQYGQRQDNIGWPQNKFNISETVHGMNLEPGRRMHCSIQVPPKMIKSKNCNLYLRHFLNHQTITLQRGWMGGCGGGRVLHGYTTHTQWERLSYIGKPSCTIARNFLEVFPNVVDPLPPLNLESYDANSFPICPKSATKLFGLYHHHPLHNGEKTMLKKKNLQQKLLDWKWPSPTTSSPISKISRTMAQEGFLSWRPQQTLESGPVYILTCFRFQTPCCWQGAEWWTVPLTWSPAITWKRGRDRWKSWKRNTIWKQGWYSVIPHGLIFYARWIFFQLFCWISAAWSPEGIITPVATTSSQGCRRCMSYLPCTKIWSG